MAGASEPPQSPAHDIARTRLKYSRSRTLGKGMFGDVYRGTLDEASPVAVKVLRNGGVGNPVAARQFRRELRRYQQLQGVAGVVRFYGSSVTRKATSMADVFVTELMAGGSLRAALDTALPSAETTLQLAEMVANALTSMHARGFSHGDLKPNNVLLSRTLLGDGLPPVEGDEDLRPPPIRAKLVDFGLSRDFRHHDVVPGDATSDEEDNQLPSVSGALQHTDPLGTPSYLAPEAWRGRTALRDEHVAFAADIYALGCLLYELESGLVPWKGYESEWAIFGAVYHDRRRPAWPEGGERTGLREVVARCWAQEAKQRPSASEVARQIRTIRRARGVDSPEDRSTRTTPERLDSGVEHKEAFSAALQAMRLLNGNETTSGGEQLLDDAASNFDSQSDSAAESRTIDVGRSVGDLLRNPLMTNCSKDERVPAVHCGAPKFLASSECEKQQAASPPATMQHPHAPISTESERFRDAHSPPPPPGSANSIPGHPDAAALFDTRAPPPPGPSLYSSMAPGNILSPQTSLDLLPDVSNSSLAPFHAALNKAHRASNAERAPAPPPVAMQGGTALLNQSVTPELIAQSVAPEDDANAALPAYGGLEVDGPSSAQPAPQEVDLSEHVSNGNAADDGLSRPLPPMPLSPTDGVSTSSGTGSSHSSIPSSAFTLTRKKTAGRGSTRFRIPRDSQDGLPGTDQVNDMEPPLSPLRIPTVPPTSMTMPALPKLPDPAITDAIRAQTANPTPHLQVDDAQATLLHSDAHYGMQPNGEAVQPAALPSHSNPIHVPLPPEMDHHNRPAGAQETHSLEYPFKMEVHANDVNTVIRALDLSTSGEQAADALHALAVLCGVDDGNRVVAVRGHVLEVAAVAVARYGRSHAPCARAMCELVLQLARARNAEVELELRSTAAAEHVLGALKWHAGMPEVVSAAAMALAALCRASAQLASIVVAQQGAHHATRALARAVRTSEPASVLAAIDGVAALAANHANELLKADALQQVVAATRICSRPAVDAAAVNVIRSCASCDLGRRKLCDSPAIIAALAEVMERARSGPEAARVLALACEAIGSLADEGKGAGAALTAGPALQSVLAALAAVEYAQPFHAGTTLAVRALSCLKLMAALDVDTCAELYAAGALQSAVAVVNARLEVADVAIGAAQLIGQVVDMLRNGPQREDSLAGAEHALEMLRSLEETWLVDPRVLEAVRDAIAITEKAVSPTAATARVRPSNTESTVKFTQAKKPLAFFRRKKR